MSFLDSAQSDAEQAGPPAVPPQGGGGPPQGGGPILAAIANRQRGPQPSAPGPGDQANSMTMLMQAIGLMQQALPGLQPGTPIQQDALKAVQRLSKHVPQGAPGAGVQRTQLEDLLRNIVKNALLQRIMGQQRQGQGQGSGAPGGAGQPAGPSPLPGAAAQAPMPATPLPGA
ncbi:MAG TPA: hypothetical protein VGJ20_20425 [Xanthobacteraceae bacterium]|jgi:hypothetical protein